MIWLSTEYFHFMAICTFINEEEEIAKHHGTNSASACRNLQTSHTPIYTEAGTRGVL